MSWPLEELIYKTTFLFEGKKTHVFGFQNFSVPEDVSAYDGLELRLKGDGRRYKLIIRTSRNWDTVGYTASFDTVAGQWQSVSDIIDPLFKWLCLIITNSQAVVPFPTQIRLPFSSLRPIFRARTVSDAPPFDATSVISLQACFLLITVVYVLLHSFLPCF